VTALAFAQGFLGLLALRDVLEGAGHAVDAAAGRVAQDERPAANPAVGAVLVPEAKFHPRQGLPALEMRAKLALDAVEVIGMDARFPFLAPVGKLMLLIAHHRLVPR